MEIDPHPIPLTRQVGMNIRQARARIGLSQTALAERIGEDQPSISKWELGRAMPRPAALTALAGALGIEVAELFEDTAEMGAA